MGQFPTEFPTMAAQVLIQSMLHKDSADKGRMALAGYDLLGFGLFKYFGDVKYMANALGDEDMAQLMASAPPNIVQALEGLKTLDQSKAIPEWAVPLIMEAVTWLMKTLIERLNKPKPAPVPLPAPTS